MSFVFAKNVFEKTLLLKLNNYIYDIIKNKKIVKTNLNSWPNNVKGNSNLVEIIPINNHMQLFRDIYNQLKRFDIKYNELSLQIYIWHPGSYIKWHDDGDYKLGFTLYLNEYWNEDFGGIFLYKKENNIFGFKPEHNTIIFVKDKLEHSVSMTTPDAPLRITLQGFCQ